MFCNSDSCDSAICRSPEPCSRPLVMEVFYFSYSPFPLFTGVRGRISMKMSSRRASFVGGSVTQHRPHNIDPPTRQGDESLGVPLTLGPLAIVEGPGFWRTTQAGKR